MNWTQIKKEISPLESKELLKLIGDLYKLNPENKRFLATRFSSPESQLAEYKKLIAKAVNPPFSENAKINFTEGKKIISSFKKASGDSEMLANLMLHYVEEANEQTLEYGDMWEQYYISIENMFEKTLKLILELKTQRKDFKHLQDRAWRVVQSTNGIGWGYHDQLSHFYAEAFQKNEKQLG